MNNTRNNFTLLRLVLATLVICGHFKTLPGNPTGYGIYSYADFAVDAFFVVSGYLIAGSFDRLPHLGGFYIHRIFRIYPLYALAILAQALTMGMLLPGGVAGHVGEIIQYIMPNLVLANFLHYDVGGILSGLNNPGINPSLWTLKIEVAFYILLPFLWMLQRRYGLGFLVMVYIASTLFAEVALHYGAATIAKQLPGQLRFFVVGIALYRYRNAIQLPWQAAAVIAALLLAVCTFRQSLPIMAIYPLLVGCWVFLCALRLPVVPLGFDISYGVYLIHGPLIQLSLLLGIYRDATWFLLALISITYALALVADVTIERPGIMLGKRLADALMHRQARVSS